MSCFLITHNYYVCSVLTLEYHGFKTADNENNFFFVNLLISHVSGSNGIDSSRYRNWETVVTATVCRL